MRGQPVNVLLVDDNRGDLVLIQRMLEDVRPGGFAVEWAATFEAGLAAMFQSHPDVYLIDYRLGGVHNGLDLLKVAASHAEDTPVILLTGQGDIEVDLEASRLGATDYLEKSRLDGAQLERAIRYALERKHMESMLRRSRDELEQKVEERTAHLEALNRQLQSEIEERKRVENLLRQVQKLDAIGRVVSGVAHDFNNYLGVMRGYLEMAIEMVSQDDRVHRYLLNILQAINGSTRLANHLLTFSSQRPMEKVLLDLNRRVRQQEKMLRRVLSERISIDLDLAPDLWTTVADPSNLDQVVMNLAVNARDAMPEGGELTIRTRNVTVDEALCRKFPQATPGEFLCLSVSDTGEGMDRNVLAHLFEPFFTTKSPNKGTGLGLSVVYGIVRLHQGWIAVESQSGHGSCFDIYLPAQRTDEAIAVEENDFLPGAAVGGHGERIMVVEDDPAFGEMIREALIKGGYDVSVCATAAEAGKLFQREMPDLVLSDMVLPDGSGGDLVQGFAKEQGGLAALLMTGYPEEWAKRETLERAGWRILQKPMPIETLLTQVRTALET